MEENLFKKSQAQINISRDLPFIDMLLLSSVTRSSVRKASPGYTPVHTVVTLICVIKRIIQFSDVPNLECVAKKNWQCKIRGVIAIRHGGQHDEL